MTIFPERWIATLILFSVPMYPIYNVSFYALITNYSSSKRRARAYGIFNSIGTAGYVVGTLILGAITDYSSKDIFIMPPLSIITVGMA